jgi:hypothetical protein
VGELAHVPVVVVKVDPVRAVPLITGIVLCIGTMSVTELVSTDNAALEEPTPLFATTDDLIK